MHVDRLGPYRIVRRLGRGGMGTVFHGVNTETGEEAAVKLLATALAHDEGFRDRFASEIETLKKLHHPNIDIPIRLCKNKKNRRSFFLLPFIFLGDWCLYGISDNALANYGQSYKYLNQVRHKYEDIHKCFQDKKVHS